MPRPHDINPRTGKRFGWEADQARLREQELISGALQTTRKQLALLDRQKKAAEARDSLLTFTKFTMPDPEAPNDVGRTRYEAAKFHEQVAATIEKFLKGELRHADGRICTQLIFCMPPRHGKTELATKRACAWYSGRHPDNDIIVASASDLLAQDMGADVRTIMGTPQYKQVFPRHKLMRGGSAKDNLQTDKGGRLIFAGRGGTINGRGAHLLLIDDLYKDFEEARSDAVREATWNWLTKVALMRRMGKRLTIITMTRWHSDDVIGRLTDPENPAYNAEEAASWMIIRLPGIAEEDDPLGRAPGEALWPARYDEEYHRGNQRRDPLGFAALVQQTPTVADGVLFRRETIQFVRPQALPENLRFYCASDHAVGTKQRNDPSCLLKVGVDPQNNIYIFTPVWKRMPTDEAVEAMLTMATDGQNPLLWWAERGHISASIGPFLRKRMLETGRYINLVEVTPKADKEQRAQSIAARVAMGKVYFVVNRDGSQPQWVERAVNEMMAFPNGVHDDFVDALAYIGLGLGSQFGGSDVKAKKAAEPQPGSLAWLRQQNARDAQRHTYRGY
jgi:predicted phage terminase large subunit-like protein